MPEMGKGGKKGVAAVPCKFFASARGCSNAACPFLHGSSNASFANYANATRQSAGPTANAKALGTPSGTTPGKTGREQPPADSLCKFFGSAKGCGTEDCPFSHDFPNSVPPCTFKQNGNCEKGDACTFRHVPWASADAARAHYSARDKGTVELSTHRYKQLHRDDKKEPDKMGKEHVEVEHIVEREMQVETYGSNAVRMMEKMGYKIGSGLGKDEQGSAKLTKPMAALEAASQNTVVLGVGAYSGSAKATVAERAARMASARAQKMQRVDEGTFFVNNLLSDDESTDDEDATRKVRDVTLATNTS